MKGVGVIVGRSFGDGIRLLTGSRWWGSPWSRYITISAVMTMTMMTATGDPLQHVTVLERVKFVIKGGRVAKNDRHTVTRHSSLACAYGPC
jgi:hypothetical protein